MTGETGESLCVTGVTGESPCVTGVTGESLCVTGVTGESLCECCLYVLREWGAILPGVGKGKVAIVEVAIGSDCQSSTVF